ncbi:MAG: NUDIX domain-containing protein [Candidatus Doudnabacteria bacterium]|nr:NUDIX domain-containing protein [Candidatus Doudnabacteria bacterium]
MINKNELLFAVDENNQPIEPVERHRAHSEGVWHRNAHVWVLNSKNEVLCNKRSVSKDHNPGLWEAFFGGHILVGISPVQGAIMELHEELGLRAEEPDLKLWKVVKHYYEDKNKEFIYVYIFFWDGDVDSLSFEKEEMDEVKWVALELLKKLDASKDESWTFKSFIHVSELLEFITNLKINA